jgi:Asp-tRNA(Asn)/Glu-tRNA(Gln) amidotransferase C subunit
VEKFREDNPDPAEKVAQLLAFLSETERGFVR